MNIWNLYFDEECNSKNSYYCYIYLEDMEILLIEDYIGMLLDDINY